MIAFNDSGGEKDSGVVNDSIVGNDSGCDNGQESVL